jgi:hypothetical protein
MSELNAAQNPLSSPNQRRPQRDWVVGKCGGQALHPVNSVLAYRGCMCRLSLPAQCRVMRAGTAWEYGVHDGVRGNSGLVRQIDLSPLPAQPPPAICSNFVNAAIHAPSVLERITDNSYVIRLGKSCRQHTQNRRIRVQCTAQAIITRTHGSNC